MNKEQVLFFSLLIVVLGVSYFVYSSSSIPASGLVVATTSQSCGPQSLSGQLNALCHYGADSAAACASVVTSSLVNPQPDGSELRCGWCPSNCNLDPTSLSYSCQGSSACVQTRACQNDQCPDGWQKTSVRVCMCREAPGRQSYPCPQPGQCAPGHPAPYIDIDVCQCKQDGLYNGQGTCSWNCLSRRRVVV